MAVGTQFHVLAVDDSIIDRKLIERLLKTSCFKVTAVDSVHKALQFLGLEPEETTTDSDDLLQDSSSFFNIQHPAAKKNQINLIVSDYSMPGMTGYDLLKRIKKSKYHKDIPFIILSSENIPKRIKRCLEDGAEEFLLKPVRLSDMDRIKPHVLKQQQRNVFLSDLPSL